MKTLTFKYLKLFLLAVAMINLTSCEIEIDDFYDDDNIGGSYYNKSLDLCSRPWADTFYEFLSRSPWRRLYPGGISQRTLFRIGVLLYLELGGPFAILPSDGIWSR